jgi:hypothetical protein
MVDTHTLSLGGRVKDTEVNRQDQEGGVHDRHDHPEKEETERQRQ